MVLLGETSLAQPWLKSSCATAEEHHRWHGNSGNSLLVKTRFGVSFGAALSCSQDSALFAIVSEAWRWKDRKGRGGFSLESLESLSLGFSTLVRAQSFDTSTVGMQV